MSCDAYEYFSKQFKIERRNKRKKWLREHIVIYRKVDDWYQNCAYKKWKEERNKIRQENDIEELKRLLEELKEIDKQQQEELKKEIAALLKKRARYLTYSEDIKDEDFENEIVPLMDLLECYEPTPRTSEEQLRKEFQALVDRYNKEVNANEQEEN